MTLWVTLGMGALAVALGLCGAASVSSSRGMVERAEAQRLIELAASSAFEEASARLERSMPVVRFLHRGRTRDLGRSLPWPAEVDPVVVQRDWKRDGVVVSAVKVHAHPWQARVAPDGIGAYRVLELGLVDLAVDVEARVGATRVTATVRARRYAGLHADEVTARGSLWLLPTDLARRQAAR